MDQFDLEQFSLRPAELKEVLDRRVVGQEHAKKVVAAALCGHYTTLRYITKTTPDSASLPFRLLKPNFLLIGPTGTGKTLLIETAANYIGAPFITADATALTAKGIVGDNADDLPRRLFERAGGNKVLAERGIIFIDEIDKIARNKGIVGKDFSGSEVQFSLLKIIEGAEIIVQSHVPRQGSVEINVYGSEQAPYQTIHTENM